MIDKFRYACQAKLMMKKLRNFVLLMWLKIKIIANLVAENIALRQQLAVMKRTNKRPKILMIDRLFWVVLSRIWKAWRESLVIVTPDTVIRWHRKGFKLFWAFKSKGAGRPCVNHEIRKLYM
jgi:putative transposase